MNGDNAFHFVRHIVRRERLLADIQEESFKKSEQRLFSRKDLALEIVPLEAIINCRFEDFQNIILRATCAMGEAYRLDPPI